MIFITVLLLRIQLRAIDRDAGKNSALKYSITSSYPGQIDYFTINETTGVVYSNRKFDHEVSWVGRDRGTYLMGVIGFGPVLLSLNVCWCLPVFIFSPRLCESAGKHLRVVLSVNNRKETSCKSLN